MQSADGEEEKRRKASSLYRPVSRYLSAAATFLTCWAPFSRVAWALSIAWGYGSMRATATAKASARRFAGALGGCTSRATMRDVRRSAVGPRDVGPDAQLSFGGQSRRLVGGK